MSSARVVTAATIVLGGVLALTASMPQTPAAPASQARHVQVSRLKRARQKSPLEAGPAAAAAVRERRSTQKTALAVMAPTSLVADSQPLR